MVVDILRHELVSPHEILPKKEAKELLVSMRISADQLPAIYANDPVMKILNAKKGDIVKVTRKSPTAGESIYYRIVV